MFMETASHRFLVVADAGNQWVTPEALDLLRSLGTVRQIDLSAHKDDNERCKVFEAELRQADVLISAPWRYQNIPPFTSERLDGSGRKLRVIAGTFDNRFEGWLDVAEVQRRGIRLIDTSRSMTPTVAEFALAMMLNLLRDIPTEIDRVRRGKWREGWYDLTEFVAGDLTGRRVGLAGFGSICRRLAELLGPFRCEVRTYDPFVPNEVIRGYGVGRASSMEELAAWSELFVVGIPPTPATLKIISRQAIDALQRGALFILATRMAVVEQDALWRRTRAGEIRAAVDVFDPEPPPPDSPIRSDPNIFPTPHIAGNTAAAHRRCFMTSCQEALSALSGNPLKYEVSIWDAKMYAGKV
jgi:phosphoglycerate dehydrogenase-like enzyme